MRFNGLMLQRLFGHLQPRWGFILVILIIGLTLFAVGCTSANGGASKPSSGVEQEETTDSSTTKQANKSTGETIQGGVFKRLFSDPATLDPHLTTDATSATIVVEVFGGLVTINPDLEITADLAEDWKKSDDGRVYTFFLRKNATFHNGKAVTAHDFKWSLERAADALTESLVVDQYLGDIVGVKEKLNGEARDIKGVRVIDDHSLEITIDEPKSYFLAKLTYPTAFVLDQDNVESGRRWMRKPNGTGPFKLSEYVPGELLILESNPNYHLGPPHIARAELILSGGTAMLMYENDEIHTTSVGLADLDRLLDPTNKLNTELHRSPPSFSVSYIGMNTIEPPFDDLKVRQALNFAINRKEITSLVLADLVTPANGILPPGFPAYNPTLNGYEFNPEKARKLLSDSKYGGNLANFPPILLTVSGGFGAAVGLDLEVILESWRKELGIEVEIQQTEFATYLQDLHKRRFQMFDIGWIADYPDPENFLDLLFYSKSSNNHTSYTNPEVDALLVEARTETDREKRFKLYQEAEQIIVSEAPWIPLWHSGDQYVLIKPQVKDYYLTQLIVPRLRFVQIAE